METWKPGNLSCVDRVIVAAIVIPTVLLVLGLGLGIGFVLACFEGIWPPF